MGDHTGGVGHSGLNHGASTGDLMPGMSQAHADLPE